MDRLEKALTIAQIVGIVITFILGAIIVSLSSSMLNKWPPLQPPQLDYSTDANAELSKKNIENFKNLSAAIQARNNQEFELIVTKVLDPIFNKLLAAVIGVVSVKSGVTIIRFLKNPVRSEIYRDAPQAHARRELASDEGAGIA